jgi:hypothetical protein
MLTDKEAEEIRRGLVAGMRGLVLIKCGASGSSPTVTSARLRSERGGACGLGRSLGRSSSRLARA